MIKRKRFDRVKLQVADAKDKASLKIAGWRRHLRRMRKREYSKEEIDGHLRSLRMYVKQCSEMLSDPANSFAIDHLNVVGEILRGNYNSVFGWQRAGKLLSLRRRAALVSRKANSLLLRRYKNLFNALGVKTQKLETESDAVSFFMQLVRTNNAEINRLLEPVNRGFNLKHAAEIKAIGKQLLGLEQELIAEFEAMQTKAK
jgi:hypothetical protein